MNESIDWHDFQAKLTSRKSDVSPSSRCGNPEGHGST